MDRFPDSIYQPKLRKRFASRFSVNWLTGCWEWNTKDTPFGYGRFNIRCVYKAAHRASWEINVGPIPEGMQVCHKCDNPRCVNPEHLFLGTQKDNIRDMMAKGRRFSGIRPEIMGERNKMSKLTNAQVSEMRALYNAGGVKQIQLAELFGVSDTTVQSIVRNKSYRSLLPNSGKLLA